MSNPVTSTQEYKQLTKILEILESQREQVIKDKEFIENAFKEALSNPIEYVESLVSGSIRLPPKLNIVNIPDYHNVGLPRYYNDVVATTRVKPPKKRSLPSLANKESLKHNEDNDNDSVGNNNSVGSNNNNNSGDNNGENITTKPNTSITTAATVTTTTTTTTTTTPTATTTTTTTPSLSLALTMISENESDITESETEKKKIINGSSLFGASRQGKTKNGFNLVYWTEEEQKRLEELLVEYPEEEIATHRWTKIANQLGNRTPAQVASRTQKYFKKLEKLGWEIPGSKPKSKSNSFKNKPTTFDNQSSEDEANKRPDKKHKTSSNPNTPLSTPIKKSSSNNNIGKYSQQKPLKKINVANNINDNNGNDNNKKSVVNEKGKAIHEGYKCDGCDTEPIVGIRWHCEECLEEVDLCSDCHGKYEEIGPHLSSHHMTSFENPDSYFLDNDYKYTYDGGEINYLDPNYR